MTQDDTFENNFGECVYFFQSKIIILHETIPNTEEKSLLFQCLW